MPPVGLAEFCQFAAISVDDGFADIDAAACMRCGVCIDPCAQEAIELVRDLAKGEPLEIQKPIARAAQATRDAKARLPVWIWETTF